MFVVAISKHEKQIEGLGLVGDINLQNLLDISSGAF
jgi:hypothetical protein